MLVYQRMDIGTAKPSAEELAAVPHHLIDILPPDAVFSVVDFKEKAEKIIADINSRGKLPVIVGGTGLYIKALLENYEFNTVEECSELRSELEAFAEEHGNSALYEKLQALDLEAASNYIQMIAEELSELLNAQSGEKIAHRKSEEWPYETVVFGLRMERESLYARINARVDKMMAEGLVEKLNLYSTVGYRGCSVMQRWLQTNSLVSTRPDG
ncbi:MAG: tRNA (adenosine(37)-N6)-dimethylallyltransferase MiaA [Phascolarctobacterium faecium]